MKTRMMSARCCCGTTTEVPVYSNLVQLASLQAIKELAFNWWYYDDNYRSPAQTEVFGRDNPEFGKNGNSTYEYFFFTMLSQIVNVSQGTTIQSASLDLFRATTSTSRLTSLPIPIRVFVWNADTHFNSIGTNPFASNGPPSTPLNTWGTPAGSWSSEITATLETNLEIDLTSYIQDIVNRPGWSSGNKIALCIATDYINATTDFAEKTWYGLFSDSTVLEGTSLRFIHNYIRIEI